MPLWLRRTVYLAFILVFLLIAPLLALYSMGYRYHWGKHRFERTGLISISGQPRDVRVLVDGIERASRLPAHIGGLGENEYVVRIERDGFHPWEQRLSVMSGRAITIDDVRLFRETDPTLIFPATLDHFSQSATGVWAAFVRRASSFEELWLLDLRSGVRTLVLRVPQPSDPTARTIQTVVWSPRNAELLVTTAHDTLVVSPTAPRELQQLAPLLPQPPNAAMWELGSDDAIIAVLSGRLYRIHRVTRRAVLLPTPPPPSPFAVARGTIYTTTGRTLIALPTDGDAAEPIVELPEGMTISAYLDLQGTTLTAQTQASSNILSIAMSDGSIRIRSGTHLNGMPTRDNAIWLATPFELWMMTHNEQTTRILARRDAPIVSAALHPHAPYVFLTTAMNIVALALDTASQQTTTLATFDVIDAVALHPDGSSLWIVGRRGANEGIWQLRIQ